MSAIFIRTGELVSLFHKQEFRSVTLGQSVNVLRSLREGYLVKMYFSACLFFVVTLAGSAFAVFYTKSTDNDYPRIGRRSFYTTGGDNHYPRIGRRDAAGSQILLPGLELSNGLVGLDKRGIFTQSAHGSYPRVGRGSEEAISGEESMNEGENKLIERIEGMKEDVVEGDSVLKDGNRGLDERRLRYPLDVVFTIFDTDSDGKLSKEEFNTGVTKYRQHNPLC